MKQFKFNLPAPPSANRIWRQGNNRMHLSAAYKQWKNAAQWSMIEQLGSERPSEPLSGPFAVTIVIHASDGRNARRDVDNYAKPILDVLEYAALVEDDVLCERLLISRGDRMQTHHVEVILSELPGEPG